MEQAVSKVHEISPPTTIVPPEQQWREEDSINLVDLWLELSKRRTIIFSSVTLALVAGLLVAFLLPQKYMYSTTIEIGTIIESTPTDKGPQLIDEPETVLAKIKESYIPLTQQNIYAAQREESKIYKINATVPKGSQLVVLKTKGAKDDAPNIIAQLQAVVDNLLHDHQRVMNINHGKLETRLNLAKIKLDELSDPNTLAAKVNELESQLNNARIKLDELQDSRVIAVPRQGLEAKLERAKKHLMDLIDQAKLLKARYQRLDETDALLKKQIANLETQIKAAFAHRQQAINNLQNESSAMTMLLIDNEIQKNRNQLASLQERLQITQHNLREELEEKLASNGREQGVQNIIITKASSELSRLNIDNKRDLQRHEPKIGKLNQQITKLMADNKRAIAKQKLIVKELEIKIANAQETHAVVPPMRSVKPTGSGKSLIIILALILGLMIGIFAAFFSSFLDKVKQQATT